MPRTRISTTIMSPGKATYQGNSTQRGDESVPLSYDRVVDEFGVRDGSFTVDHVYTSGRVSGKFPPFAVPYREYQNWLPSYFVSNNANSVAHLAVDIPSLSESAVKVVAATNPSRSVIDLPVAIFELREIPHLLKEAGSSYLKKYAQHNLRWEFGFAPIASDYMKLLDFIQNFDKQHKILSDLEKGPSVRKATVANASEVSFPGTISVVHSSPSELSMSAQLVTKTTSVKRWGYVTWTPSVPNLTQWISESGLSSRQLVRRIALGGKIDALTIWNALPWSWLIDWFSNVGEYLEANRRVIPVNPGLPSICTTYRTVETWANTNNAANIKHGTFTFQRIRVTKMRQKASAFFPSASLPLLTQRQVKILASLAVLRLR